MNKGFTIAEILLMCLITASLFSQNFNYISDYDGQGVPLDMVNTSVSQSLIDNIGASFPEGYPVPEYNPEYISDGVETNVILSELADVWVTFIGEGAGYKNVLGYYTYDAFNPPSSPPSDQEITIIFPNVSAAGSGGGLIVGDKMYLGQFPENTGIGWVLIANGWNGGAVTYGNWMLYSTPDFNPEGSQELQKHNVNLYDNNELVVVFGFEDIRRDFGSCDQDFNDALFLVTANPFNAIETGNYNPVSTDGGGQSSGNGGGLESHRGLSSQIAQRTFDRSSKLSPEAELTSSTRSNSLLSDVVPISLKTEDQRRISSPTDLESITKANRVWSADYILDDQCFATVFATETTEGIYDHTKAVCDRLSGSEIIDIKEVEIAQQKFLLTSLQKKDKSIEYSISFSIEITQDSSYRVFSRWAVDQYDKGDNFLNYQVWASAPYLSFDITKQILENIQKTHDIIVPDNVTSYLPDVYVKKGTYTNNVIELLINNTSDNPVTVNLVGSMTSSEIDQDHEQYLKTILIPSGEHTYTIENPGNNIFDLEIKLRKSGETAYDVSYFSDGAWGLDYSDKNTNINDLKITANTNLNEENYSISRNISVEFDSDDYLSIYRHLKPSGGTLNLEDYNSIEFEGEFTKPITLRIIKDGIREWEDQFSFVIIPSEVSTTYTIPFGYFRNNKGEELSTTDVKMLVFTQDSKLGIDEKIALNNVIFSNVEQERDYTKSEFTLFPNPTVGKLNMSCEGAETSSGVLKVYNLLGNVLHQEKITINKGLNFLNRDLSNLEKGAHIIQLEINNGVSYRQKVIMF